MNVTVRKIGNSEGVILPKEVLERHNLRAGDTLVLTEDGNELRLSPAQDDPEEFERKMKIARERMKKYEVAYRALAK
ncbi:MULTISPECIES: AbrB/MazE/SpoVT family DNA-binding domain-containing protein [Aminobacter]|jgi:putative addiction module antidote|uniref:AbrB family transcriptional regulator n=2 Tax=Aminobacter TaxID=31988 RepID=A0AAC8YSX2_AMIAI|nr:MULTISPECIES: AbrB/MazE/SpoVT family DNA-binding domain-containing protein [Aminobacter]AMS43629.1 AbrB family transcriptional regulator [Aminobacter aminovorans]MBA8909153.1 putative addiction module antidote [Aminobacter ciceronei]MBA9022989.1 putative addiction module antidote [Aminobacter ciceronei]MBB3705229.1 putative addiction module antidote [Aminobacter aminovorans]MRX33318.1 AbrB/MazE/SpoVT family DNA-binding domain-containing protein [Aminobacter sp. MDW-2]